MSPIRLVWFLLTIYQGGELWEPQPDYTTCYRASYLEKAETVQVGDESYPVRQRLCYAAPTTCGNFLGLKPEVQPFGDIRPLTPHSESASNWIEILLCEPSFVTIQIDDRGRFVGPHLSDVAKRACQEQKMANMMGDLAVDIDNDEAAAWLSEKSREAGQGCVW